MSLVAQVALTIGALLACSIGPGLVFVRHFRWRPMETLCASIALSFFLVYLVAGVIYIFDLVHVFAYAAPLAGAACLVACRGDLRRLWRDPATRTAFLAWLALLGWLLFLDLRVRNYSGGQWTGDWYEHFARARFFRDHLALDTMFIGTYLLPARPMMNLLVALIFWMTEARFELFQIASAYLSTLAFLPCCLLARRFAPGIRSQAWVLAGVFALSPTFVWNVAYPWTKLFAAFYVLTAVGLYLAAWRGGSMSRMVAAFACLAVGMLVHYSVAPVVIAIVGHYLVVVFRHRRHRWRELAASAAVSIASFLTWLGWSLANYGLSGTFGTNSTVTGARQFTALGNVLKVLTNTVNTLIPFPLRGSLVDHITGSPPEGLAYVRDVFFVIYQVSFPAMLGLGGLILCGWQLWRCLHARGEREQARRRFWIAFVLIVACTGFLVHDVPEFWGIGQICLQPLALLGLTWGAAGFMRIPPTVRRLALGGIAADAVLGVLLQFHELQNDFAIVVQAGVPVATAHLEMGAAAAYNGVGKFRFGLTFLGDHVAAHVGLLEIVSIAIAAAIWIALWRLPSAHSVGNRRSGTYSRP